MSTAHELAHIFHSVQVEIVTERTRVDLTRTLKIVEINDVKTNIWPSSIPRCMVYSGVAFRPGWAGKYKIHR